MAAPMAPDDEMNEAPEPVGAEQAEGEGDGSFTIEITCKPDGTYTVAVESADQESAEGAGAPEGAEGGQTYSSPKECLTAVLGIMKTGSQSDPQAEKSAMADGFKGASIA